MSRIRGTEQSYSRGEQDPDELGPTGGGWPVLPVGARGRAPSARLAMGVSRPAAAMLASSPGGGLKTGVPGLGEKAG